MNQMLSPDLSIIDERGAIVSPCGRYRYKLWRQWHPGRPMATFIMLNPSTADGKDDDPTIRKCIGFAKRWGMGGIFVGNLFAVRATNPDDMMRARDPVGPDNKAHLERICEAAADDLRRGGVVVCAWGALGNHMGQDQTFLGWCDQWCIRPKALRLTAYGLPAHPLYIPYDAKPFDLI